MTHEQVRDNVDVRMTVLAATVASFGTSPVPSEQHLQARFDFCLDLVCGPANAVRDDEDEIDELARRASAGVHGSRSAHPTPAASLREAGAQAPAPEALQDTSGNPERGPTHAGKTGR